MIRRAVARTALPQSAAVCSLEKLLRSEGLCRPRPEAIEGEFRLLVGLDIDKHVIVLLFRSLSLPVEVRRIARGHLDARATREDWVLFGATTPQHQILHPVYFVDFGGVDVTI